MQDYIIERIVRFQIKVIYRQFYFKLSLILSVPNLLRFSLYHFSVFA